MSGLKIHINMPFNHEVVTDGHSVILHLPGLKVVRSHFKKTLLLKARIDIATHAAHVAPGF